MLQRETSFQKIGMDDRPEVTFKRMQGMKSTRSRETMSVLAEEGLLQALVVVIVRM